jgi:DNA helicase II / ATP-dependent DNA helicase PcrA
MSQVEIFTTVDFLAALSVELGQEMNSVQNLGFIDGELRFRWTIATFEDNSKKVCIDINSSIEETTGHSADTGGNSIRAWIVDQDGKPLGSKTQKWVTREVGWQDRMAKMLVELSEMAKEIGICKSCGELEGIYIAKTEKNKGRKFLKCKNGCNFRWLDSEDPVCPDCGSTMVLRESKWGEFYGCSQYPKCKKTISVKNVDKSKQSMSYEDAANNIGDLKKSLVRKKDGFEPSKYQSVIFDWVQNVKPGKHLVVRALAGSGKTTTGVEMLQYTKGKEVLFVAFNKSIQQELAKRVPSHVKVLTYHALGFSACREAFELTIENVDQDKMQNILRGILDWYTYKHLYAPVKQLISLVKANLSGTSEEELDGICYHYGIETNGDKAVMYQAVQIAIQKAAENTTTVDFDDMCWLPVYYNLPMQQYDIVFVDEAQDTAKVQISLALQSIKGDGNIIAVGDDFQSMYGFRGADVDAIPNLIEHLDAEELPLSITYRCPKSHVRLVNQRFPHIPMEMWEEKQEGKILYWSENEALRLWADEDMVLCRTNAPLVRPCFELIRRGVKATIRGRDIGKGLLNLVDKMKAVDVNMLIIKLTTYRNQEVSKLVAADKNSQAQGLEDKIDTIIALLDGVNTITELEHKIKNVFSDRVGGVVFSTVHRAKGLEANRVSILRPDLLPHPMAEKLWEKQQEDNINYVALTRSKDTLVFVN